MINKDKLLAALAAKAKRNINTANHIWVEGYQAAIDVVEEAPEEESGWHECFDDDPNSFPDSDRNVLVTFSNFSLPIIGQWRIDNDGAGCWYLGDTDETFLSEDLYVDGWWELPKKPEVKP